MFQQKAFLNCASFLIVAITLASLAAAQISGAPGQPLYATSNSSATTDAQGTVIDAYVYNIYNGTSTLDVCSQINIAWSAVIGIDATIDARGFVGYPTQSTSIQNCTNHSPFPTGAHGRLLLGNIFLTTQQPLVIPSGVEVVGLGPSGIAGDTTTVGTVGPPINTVISADPFVSSFSGPVLQMGASSGSYGVKIKGLTVDCWKTSNSGCIGIENKYAGQGSTVEDVAIDNAASMGLHLVIGDHVPNDTLAAGYSGPYRNITIQAPVCTISSPCSSTIYDPIGVLIECTTATCTTATTKVSSPIVVKLDNITASDYNVNNPTNMGIMINGVPAVLTNSHVEYYNNNIQIGFNNAVTNGVKIDNVSLGTGPGGGIVNGKSSTNLQLIGITGPAGHVILKNNYPSNEGVTITGQFLGFYMLGPGTSWTSCKNNACPALLATDPGFQWRLPLSYSTF